MTSVSRAYGTGRHFTAMEQGKYGEVGIRYGGKLIRPWLYTICFQCVSEERETFHLGWWFLGPGYYPPPFGPHISSNQMDVHPWEERISSHLDVQSLYDGSITLVILLGYYCTGRWLKLNTTWKDKKDLRSTRGYQLSRLPVEVIWLFFSVWEIVCRQWNAHV